MYDQTTAATCFIDLATFSELCGFLFGGPDAITWFVAGVQKANWFSYIPIQLRHIGTVDFGQRNVAASVNRSADYVLHVWFRCQIPLIYLYQDGVVGGPNFGIFTNARLRWTDNLMHNLFEKVSITFNELVVEEFDNFFLDFNYQFRMPGAKRLGYRNQIGQILAMTDSVPVGAALGTGGYFSVPFPFWFCEDSGLALPVAALPFNDIKINYNIRAWQELVVVFPGTSVVGGTGGPDTGRVATTSDVYVFGSTTQKPSIQDPQTGAHYAVVHNDERVKMGDAPRDMLIRQVQSTQYAPFKDISSKSSFDIRLSHAIVCFFYAAQNISLLSWSQTGGGEWSNYTTLPTIPNIPLYQANGLDPIAYTTLIYENTVRLASGSDYFSLIHPNLLSDATPEETGYHWWSYSIKPWEVLKPAGCTDYSKLANVSIVHDPSPAAQASAGINTTTGRPEAPDGTIIQYPNSAGVAVDFPQKYRHIFLAINHNIARVANGSLGHPVL